MKKEQKELTKLLAIGISIGIIAYFVGKKNGVLTPTTTTKNGKGNGLISTPIGAGLTNLGLTGYNG